MAAASVMMLQACSNEDFDLGNSGFTPGNSEVEIKLSSKGAQVSTDIETRAAIEDTNQDLNMGVFCLARAKQEVNTTPADIDWSKWSGHVMKNVSSTLNGSNITWTGNYYYPISQFYAYDFYGYYPYVEDGQVSVTSNKVSVPFTLTGKEDVIWGRATSEDAAGFSAGYFRKKDHYNEVPSLSMKHMLTRLKFTLKTGANNADNNSSSDAETMKVMSVKIISAKPNVKLEWTNSTEAADNATLTTRDNSTAEFALCDAQGKEVTDVELANGVNATKPIGESIMLYPEQQYTLQVVLKSKSTNEEFTTESTLSLQQTSGKFEAGKNYNVIITVHGPKKIALNASLASWENAGEETNNNVIL